MKKLNIDFMNEFYEKYGKNKDFIISVDYMGGNGMDLVAYDVSDMLQTPSSATDFHDIVNENCLDEESFEYDRVTIIECD